MIRRLRDWLKDLQPGFDRQDLESALKKKMNAASPRAGEVVELTPRELQAVIHFQRTAPANFAAWHQAAKVK